jgi:tetratricopeptide (TPR) repeat protein
MKIRLTCCTVALIILFGGYGPAVQADLTRLVKTIQPAVAMVITYDIDGEVGGIGSGFFVEETGLLITNYHVLKGAYSAEAKVYDGRRFPISAIIAQDRSADIIKVAVDIGDVRVPAVAVTARLPSVAERVLVVGNPLGLEQTVSEGIVSAIREMPSIGSFFQISAPISPGSSGSPVMSMAGEVLGIATFQSLVGQNLNFAISGKSILGLSPEIERIPISEWTYALSNDKASVAAELCRKGFQFSIQGETKKALQYYREATEKDPTDPMAWYGLGYCYVGLDRAEEALEAYKQAVRNNPQDATAHFNLALFYDQAGRNRDAVQSYQAVIRLNPRFSPAYLNLGKVYAKLGLLEEGKRTLITLTRIEPDNAPAFFLLGITNEHLGQNEEALEAQGEVLRIDPSFAPAHFRTAQIHRKMGNVEEAVAAYKQTLRVDPEYAPAHFKIGEIYLSSGNKAGALAQYKILKELDPELANELFDLIYQ